jgi:hypothetical protein
MNDMRTINFTNYKVVTNIIYLTELHIFLEHQDSFLDIHRYFISETPGYPGVELSLARTVSFKWISTDQSN